LSGSYPVPVPLDDSKLALEDATDDAGADEAADVAPSSR
jgi:hypothetical protein